MFFSSFKTGFRSSSYNSLLVVYMTHINGGIVSIGIYRYLVYPLSNDQTPTTSCHPLHYWYGMHHYPLQRVFRPSVSKQRIATRPAAPYRITPNSSQAVDRGFNASSIAHAMSRSVSRDFSRLSLRWMKK